MLMTLHQVSCYSCDEVSPTYDGAFYTPKDIRTELRKAGWRRIQPTGRWSMQDQCPKCTAKATRKKAA